MLGQLDLPATDRSRDREWTGYNYLRRGWSTAVDHMASAEDQYETFAWHTGEKGVAARMQQKKLVRANGNSRSVPRVGASRPQPPAPAVLPPPDGISPPMPDGVPLVPPGSSAAQAADFERGSLLQMLLAAPHPLHQHLHVRIDQPPSRASPPLAMLHALDGFTCHFLLTLAQEKEKSNHELQERLAQLVADKSAAWTNSLPQVDTLASGGQDAGQVTNSRCP